MMASLAPRHWLEAVLPETSAGLAAGLLSRNRAIATGSEGRTEEEVLLH